MKGVVKERWNSFLGEECPFPSKTFRKINSYEVQTVICTEKKIFLLDNHGTILQEKSLKTILKKQDNITTPPTIIKQKETISCVFGTKKGHIVSFNLETGEQEWNNMVERSIQGTIEYDPKDQELLATTEKTIHRLTLQGKIKKTVELEEINTANAIFFDNKILLSTDQGACLLTKKGEIYWKYPTKNKISVRPLVIKERKPHLLICSDEGTIHYLDHNGEKQWDFSLEGPTLHKPLLYMSLEQEERILCTSTTNKLHAIDKETGSECWSLMTDFWINTQPIVEKRDEISIAIVGTVDGKIYCIDIDEKLETTFFPGLQNVLDQGITYNSSLSKDISKEKAEIIFTKELGSQIINIEHLSHQNSILCLTRTGQVINFKIN